MIKRYLKEPLIVLITLFYIIGAHSSWGQSYFIKKDSSRMDINLDFKPENPQSFVRIIGSSGTFTEYAKNCILIVLQDGRKFLSKEILFQGQKQAVFLEVLAEGHPSLLRLIQTDKWEEVYFLDTDTQGLIRLERSTFIAQVSPYAEECDGWKKQKKSMRYNRWSLQTFFEGVHQSKCITLPSTSYGISGSFNSLSLTAPREQSGDATLSSSHWNLGLFLYTPIGLKKNMGLMAEATFGQHGLLGSSSNENTEEEIYAEINAINLRLLGVYHFGKSISLRPYTLAGVNFGLHSVSSSQIFRSTTNSEGNIEQAWVQNTLSVPQGVGVTIGGGLQYFYVPTRYISIEANIGMLTAPNQSSFNQFQIGLRTNL